MYIKRFARFAILTGVIILLFSSCEKDKGENESYPPVLEMELDILELVNFYRDSISNVIDTINLEMLLMDDFIREEARAHSIDMASGELPLGHDGFSDRVNRIHEELGLGSAGENVASGFTTAESVVKAWIESPSHRYNIEGDYNETGIGVVQNDDGVYYYTHIFYKKVD